MMDIIQKYSQQLRAVKRETGAMPRVLFVDAPEARLLQKELTRRGLHKSGPVKLLGVPIKEFEFTGDSPQEEPRPRYNQQTHDELMAHVMRAFGFV